MTEVKYTPGPWGISKHSATSVMGEDGRRHVCSTGGYSTNDSAEDYVAENEANARLIASAPRLLAALKGLLTSGAVFDDETNPEILGAYREAIRAIQDAENELTQANPTGKEIAA